MFKAFLEYGIINHLHLIESAHSCNSGHVPSQGLLLGSKGSSREFLAADS